MYTRKELIDVLAKKNVLHTDTCDCKKIFESIQKQKLHMPDRLMDYYMTTHIINKDGKKIYYACDLENLCEFRENDINFMLDNHDESYNKHIINFILKKNYRYNTSHILGKIIKLQIKDAGEIIKKAQLEFCYSDRSFLTLEWLTFFIENKMRLSGRQIERIFENKYEELMISCMKQNIYSHYHNLISKYCPDKSIEYIENYNIKINYDIDFDDNLYEYVVKKYPKEIMKNMHHINTSTRLNMLLDIEKINEEQFLKLLKKTDNFNTFFTKYVELGYSVLNAKNIIYSRGDTASFKELCKYNITVTKDDFQQLIMSGRIDFNVIIEHGYVPDEEDIIWLLSNRHKINNIEKYVDERTFSKLWIIAKKDKPLNITNDLTEHGLHCLGTSTTQFVKYIEKNDVYLTPELLEITASDLNVVNRSGKVSYLIDRGIKPTKLAMLLFANDGNITYRNALRKMIKHY